MKQVMERRKDIAFYIKLYPLPSHKDARRKAESILCDRSMQKLEDAFARRPVPDPACKTDLIDRTIALAQKLGITGTPAIVLQDGRLIPGAVPADKIIELIDGK